MSDKSEEPTPQRLRKAREDGDSGISAQLGASLSFLAAIAVLPAAVAYVADASATDLRSRIAQAALNSPAATIDPGALGAAVLSGALPLLACVAAVAAVASFVQSGGAIATGKLTPKLDRLNFIQGFAGLFSKARLFSVARAVVLATFVVYLAWATLRDHAADFANLAGRTAYVGLLSSEITLSLMKKVAAVGVALGLVDLVVTRTSWKKKLMMSKDEIKREHKESDGDPQMKAARERAHHEMLAAAAIGNVRTATVVVVNPTHIACALRYDEKEGDDAPVVVATGEGELAERIMQAARDYGVPILRDVPLARALHELEIGDQIPEALYEAVAAVLREAWDEGQPGVVK